MNDRPALFHHLSASEDWWLVEAGRITARGSGDWPALPDHCRIIALAPAADCPVDWIALPGLPPRQAQAAARLQAGQARIDGTALHLVAGLPDGEGRVPVAAVSQAAMRQWVADSTGPIVPAAMLMTDAGDKVAAIGGEQLARLGDRAVALDPALADMMLAGRSVEILDARAVDDRLIALAANPPLDLRTGAFAPSRPSLMDGVALRRAAVLVAAILLVSLAIGVARLARLHIDIARIDNATATAASAALGREVAVEAAASELDARLTATGVVRGSATATFAALMNALEPQQAVAIDAASWDRTGTLTVTLGATRAEEINPVLLALQNAGYRITAQPRTGSDGRALGDITIRSEP